MGSDTTAIFDTGSSHDVSIHAPAWGATSPRRISLLVVDISGVDASETHLKTHVQVQLLDGLLQVIGIFSLLI
jgi:hypothetical protein